MIRYWIWYHNLHQIHWVHSSQSSESDNTWLSELSHSLRWSQIESFIISEMSEWISPIWGLFRYLIQYWVPMTLDLILSQISESTSDEYLYWMNQISQLDDWAFSMMDDSDIEWILWLRYHWVFLHPWLSNSHSIWSLIWVIEMIHSMICHQICLIPLWFNSISYPDHWLPWGWSPVYHWINISSINMSQSFYLIDPPFEEFSMNISSSYLEWAFSINWSQMSRFLDRALSPDWGLSGLSMGISPVINWVPSQLEMNWDPSSITPDEDRCLLIHHSIYRRADDYNCRGWRPPDGQRDWPLAPFNPLLIVALTSNWFYGIALQILLRLLCLEGSSPTLYVQAGDLLDIRCNPSVTMEALAGIAVP